MRKFLFKWLFKNLSYSEREELVYSDSLVKSYFDNLAYQKDLRSKPEPVVKNITVVRLDSQTYEYLEKSVGSNSVVSNNTSDIEAGFKLGVQHVLKHLRIGYVIETR